MNRSQPKVYPIGEVNECWGLNRSVSTACASYSPTALYIHIPFCAHRCGYCNFAVAANRKDMIDEYLDALEIELRLTPRRPLIETIFIGGGTPTQLSKHQFTHLVRLINDVFDLAKVNEFTVEANPNDIDHATCQHLAQLGVNRLSLGVQSFNAQKLKTLDRHHDSPAAIAAIETASKSFNNISIDLIFAAPSETVDEWIEDLKRVTTLPVQHVSTYGLTIEKGTDFWSKEYKQLLEKPPEEIELQMYEQSIQLLESHGFRHYEVSSFAKEDAVIQQSFECAHNHSYWKMSGWWAYGAGAARAIGVKRSTNHLSTRNYIRHLQLGQLPVAEQALLSDFEWTIDRYIFGMRTRRGVNISYIEEIGDTAANQFMSEITHRFCEQGHLEHVDGHLRLTHQGLLISDSIWTAIYAEAYRAEIEGTSKCVKT